MSHVIAAPQLMTAAAGDLATIGSAVDEAHAAAAPTTTAVAAAAADEVSSSIARLFSEHAQDYQAVAARAAAFGDQFVQNLKSSAASYLTIEDFLTSLLRGLGLDPSVPPGSVLCDFLGQTISIVLGGVVLGFFVSLIAISLVIAVMRALIEAITGVLS